MSFFDREVKTFFWKKGDCAYFIFLTVVTG